MKFGRKPFGFSPIYSWNGMYYALCLIISSADFVPFPCLVRVCSVDSVCGPTAYSCSPGSQDVPVTSAHITAAWLLPEIAKCPNWVVECLSLACSIWNQNKNGCGDDLRKFVQALGSASHIEKEKKAQILLTLADYSWSPSPNSPAYPADIKHMPSHLDVSNSIFFYFNFCRYIRERKECWF